MLPNFIIIGAAKAGTTALYWYLREHPQVFMSPLKETNYFAYGLDGEGRPLYGIPGMHQFPVKTLEEYQRLFADAGDSAAIGEASPMYLECPQAAGRIRDLLPNARIICCLRHPVDRAYSDYTMSLRSRGQRLDPHRDFSPSASWLQVDSHWMAISRYYDQLARYYQLFPRSQLHVFLFDDLRHSPEQVVQNLYRFLEIDPSFVPDFKTPHNVGGVPSSMTMEKLLTNSSLRSVLSPWIPRPAANWLRRLRTRNLRQAPPLPAELKRSLTRNFHDDIRRTSELIGRNLDHWR